MREIPLYLGSLTCLVVLAEFFFNIPVIQFLSKNVQDWIIVISACAMGLGACSLMVRHWEIVYRRAKGWEYSVALFGGLVIFPLTAMFAGGRTGKSFLFVYDNFFGPVGATFFSILIFYTASAAYRTFRLKNVQAGVLLVSALLLMLGRVPIGDAIWGGFPTISDWIMKVPVGSANRGILIGSSVGTMAAGIRYLIGLERSSIES
jgi:hypothetical protein